MSPLLAVFLLSLLLAAGATLLLLQASQRARRDEVQMRLRVMGGDEAAATLAYHSRDAQLGNPILRWACHLVWRTGAEIEPPAVARLLLVSTLLVPLALAGLGLLGGTAVIAVSAALGWGVLARRGAQRRLRLLEQLPPFLESAMRVLSAGNTLEESIAAAARESPEPLRPLMMSVGRQVRLGAPVESVLMEAGEIHRLRDLKVMALAAGINRKFGGSLRNILKSLIQSIRQREVAARELRALTAETRFSAIVLSVIPVSLSLYIYIKNPQYYSGMWADSAGRITLIVSVILQITGVFVIMRMMGRTGEAD